MGEECHNVAPFEMGHHTPQPLSGFGHLYVLFVPLNGRLADPPNIMVRPAFPECLVPIMRILTGTCRTVEITRWRL